MAVVASDATLRSFSHVPHEGGVMDSTVAPRAGAMARTGRFVLHFIEMCVPMCIGFAIGDALYVQIAERLGYSEPFAELPALSVLVVAVSMTAPMTAWMRYRGMPTRTVWEMSAVMPLLGAVLLVLGWRGRLPMQDLALLMHGLMMPAMLVPMLLRLDLYTGSMRHAHG